MVAVVIPAKDEEATVADTVAAVGDLPGVDLVVVVDDGSQDATGERVTQAGAVLVRHERSRGKSAALASGVARVAQQEASTGSAAHLLLLVDADLGASAAALAPLIDAVTSGGAALAVANIPPTASSRGGGRVVRLAQRQIEAMTGRRIAQPLNGMRCLTREAWEAASPLARGWGVEAVMLVDVLDAGLPVVEVPVAFEHRQTGTDLAGRLHRARQLRDVALALTRVRLNRARRRARHRSR